MAKKKPTGFIAICQCKNVIGALDYQRTDKKEAGKIMGAWVSDGCTIEPRFTSKWSVDIKPCECGKVIDEETKLKLKTEITSLQIRVSAAEQSLPYAEGQKYRDEARRIGEMRSKMESLKDQLNKHS